MASNGIYINAVPTLAFLKLKAKDYALLFKVRLSFTVVFSSLMAYAIAAFGEITVINLLYLFLGGFCITASSNAINEILEKDYDKLMKRTQNRPLATGRMQVTEAVLVAGITGIAGIVTLWYFFNPLGALLGTISLFTYAFVYTPLKRLSPIAVAVGAIPGAMPPLIGWVCATGTIGIEASVLFGIQFLWQFPHFWAIAWMAHDDYTKAGFKLLPAGHGQDKYTAFLALVYTIILLPVSLIPVIIGLVSIPAGVVIFVAGLLFAFQSFRLLKTCEMKDARKLMFASIIYLPVVLTALLVGNMLL